MSGNFKVPLSYDDFIQLMADFRSPDKPVETVNSEMMKECLPTLDESEAELCKGKIDH